MSEQKFLLELFSGSGGFSKYLRNRKFRVFSFDIQQGPRGDLEAWDPETRA